MCAQMSRQSALQARVDAGLDTGITITNVVRLHNCDLLCICCCCILLLNTFIIPHKTRISLEISFLLGLLITLCEDTASASCHKQKH